MKTSTHPPLALPGLLALVVMLGGCIDLIDDLPFCADSAPEPESISRSVTWHADVAPIILGRCARCHAEGEIGPFPLTTFEETFVVRESVRASVVARTMPPWLPAACCNEFFNDISLSDAQIALIEAWVDQGAPEGDPALAAEPLAPVGGLSRVDVAVEMPEAYLPQPAPGRVDDFRCFVLDWPETQPAFVTGLNPIPGARQVVHHLIVASVSGATGASLRKLEGRDGRPGFPCEGGLGATPLQAVLGGSLLGGDFPGGLGTRVEPGSKILLNIHYSLVGVAPALDRTRIEFRLDESARPALSIPIANPAWLLGDAMLIEAGEANKTYSHQFDPVLLTQGDPIEVWGFSPHMHALGSRLKAAVVRKNGAVECVTEIPDYDYGWEQPFWFDTPLRFEDGDQLYIQCHFDNSRQNQPIVGGQRPEPRDIAWGTDNQEMCTGFFLYTPAGGR